METVIPFVDLVAQHRAMNDEVTEAVHGVLSRCDFINGRQVQVFEESFAEYIGVRHAVGMSNGLDALRLALTVLGVGEGDEVIIPANTYIATALAVSAVGARPVLVDCSSDDYEIDPNQIEAALTPRTRALMPVHLTGQSADMDAILAIARRYGLHVVEDAAQAHGTLYKGARCGSLGTLACFSFYPSKNLGCCGDGGIVVTNDSALADKLRCLRDYGQRKKYEHIEKGFNARLDTMQAAILNVKLPHLDKWNSARVRHAETYRRLLSAVPGLKFQQAAPFSTHIYHLFVIELENRDALADHLRNNGIQTAIHYPAPIHLQPAYRDLEYREGAFPRAERLAKRMLSLPMYAELTNEQIEYVADQIRKFCARDAEPATLAMDAVRAWPKLARATSVSAASDNNPGI